MPASDAAAGSATAVDMASGGAAAGAMPGSAATAARIDALRARGADPVRLRLIEALARRAAGHEGETRRLLEARIAELADACAARLDDAAARQPVPAPAPLRAGERAAAGARESAIGALLAHLARQAPARADTRASEPAPTPAPSPSPASRRGAARASAAPMPPAPRPAPAPDALRYFQRTWSRLNADRRVAQSRSSLPENAGPLNSHQLLHRSLTLMRTLSPEYLERFVAQVDALLWIEQSNEAREMAPPARAEGKGTRGRQA